MYGYDINSCVVVVCLRGTWYIRWITHPSLGSRLSRPIPVPVPSHERSSQAHRRVNGSYQVIPQVNHTVPNTRVPIARLKMAGYVCSKEVMVTVIVTVTVTAMVTGDGDGDR